MQRISSSNASSPEILGDEFVVGRRSCGPSHGSDIINCILEEKEKNSKRSRKITQFGTYAGKMGLRGCPKGLWIKKRQQNKKEQDHNMNRNGTCASINKWVQRTHVEDIFG
jgi:hypothetical protein